MFISLGSVASASAQQRVLFERGEPFTSIAVGDIDRDGTTDVVVSGEQDVWRLAIEGTTTQEIEHLRGAPGDSIIHLDLIDIDGDGREELFVTNERPEGVTSYFLSLGREGKWVAPMHRFPWYFRVASAPCGGSPALSRCLLGQRTRVGQRFAGPVVPLRWQAGAWDVGRRIDLPRFVDLYDFQWFSMNDQPQVASVARNGQVKLWERADGRWRVVERFPHRYAAFRGLCLAPRSSPYEPTNLAAAECLRQPPVVLEQEGSARLAWIAQLPVLGGAVGRLPYWRTWECVTGEMRGGEGWNVQSTLSGDGMVTDLARSAEGDLLIVVQRGRGDPFSVPLKSQVLMIGKHSPSH